MSYALQPLVSLQLYVEHAVKVLCEWMCASFCQCLGPFLHILYEISCWWTVTLHKFSLGESLIWTMHRRNSCPRNSCPLRAPGTQTGGVPQIKWYTTKRSGDFFDSAGTKNQKVRNWNDFTRYVSATICNWLVVYTSLQSESSWHRKSPWHMESSWHNESSLHIQPLFY